MIIRPVSVAGVVASVVAALLVGVAPTAAAGSTSTVQGSTSSRPLLTPDAVVGAPLAEVEPAGGGFVAVTPARLLDTESGGSTVDGQGVGGGAVTSTARTTVVAGRGGVPATGVAAVVLNVTAVSPTADGYVSVYPTGESTPNASTLHVREGSTTSNVATTKVGAGGAVSSVVSTGSTHLQVEVVGYWPADGSFVALSPGRLLDTRSSGTTIDGQSQGGGAVAAATTRPVRVLGRHGIPTTGVAAVVLNVSASAPSAATRVTVYPRFAPRPSAWNLNVAAGESRSTMVIVQPGAGGSLALHNHGTEATHLWADVAGYVPADTSFTSVAPGRLLDTRPSGFTVDGDTLGGGAVGANRTVDVQVTGRHGIPSSGVSAAVLTVTGLYPTRTTGITAHPAGEPRPESANLHLVAGVNRTNLVVVPLGASGAISLHNAAGSAHLLASVVGYVVAPATGAAAIAGTVTDANGSHGPVGGVTVKVTSAAGEVDESVTTDASGNYEVPGLAPAEDYLVCFDPSNATNIGDGLPFREECHDDAPSPETATTVSVTAGTTTTVDAALTRDEALTGLVTDDGPGGAPIPGVYVTVRTDLDRGDHGSATTGPDGRYRIEGLPPGIALAVCFWPADTGGAGSSTTGYRAECHENWDEQEQDWPPSMVTLSSGETTIDAGLRHAAAVTGVVTDGATGAALAGVQVDVGGQRVTTGADGRYWAEGLRPSTNAGVCFTAAGVTGGTETGYLDECQEGVTLTTDAVTTVDAALDGAATLTGLVTDAGAGAGPLADVWVLLVQGTREWSVPTGADGRYRFGGLPVGADYTVCFSTDDATGGGSTAGYLRECHDDLAHGQGVTPVTLTSGTTTIDAALARAAAVTGVVTDPAGSPVTGVEVHVTGSSGDSWGSTDADGRYLAPRLPPGTGYTVCFTGGQHAYSDGSSTGYLDECHDDVATGGTPTPVTLTGGDATTIDAVLSPGAAVTGVVTDEATEELADVRVTVTGAGGAPATPVTLTAALTTTIDASLARRP